jgi:hypothetical protein
MPPVKPPTKEEAIKLTRGPYRLEVAKAISGSIGPFMWRESTAAGEPKIRNGTVFFLSAERTFMVTADHVFAAYLGAREKFGHFARCQIGNLRYDPEDRIIARSRSLDIATFSISDEEVSRTHHGRFAMSFDPMLPQPDRGVFFAGFPGLARLRLSELEIENGIFAALTVADNVTDRQISGHFNGERQVDTTGWPTTPQGYDIGESAVGPS